MADAATSIAVITYSTAQKVRMERQLNSSQPQCHKTPGTIPVLTVEECIVQGMYYITLKQPYFLGVFFWKYGRDSNSMQIPTSRSTYVLYNVHHMRDQ